MILENLVPPISPLRSISANFVAIARSTGACTSLREIIQRKEPWKRQCNLLVTIGGFFGQAGAEAIVAERDVAGFRGGSDVAILIRSVDGEVPVAVGSN